MSEYYVTVSNVLDANQVLVEVNGEAVSGFASSEPTTVIVQIEANTTDEARAAVEAAGYQLASVAQAD